MAYRTEMDADTSEPCLADEKLPYIVVVGHDFAGGSPGLGARLRILWEDNMTSYKSLPKFIKENCASMPQGTIFSLKKALVNSVPKRAFRVKGIFQQRLMRDTWSWIWKAHQTEMGSD
jgi:hypothetical protein